MAAARLSEIVFHNFQIVEILHVDYLLFFIILHDLSASANTSAKAGMHTAHVWPLFSEHTCSDCAVDLCSQCSVQFFILLRVGVCT
jgi:hypothetical protein